MCFFYIINNINKINLCEIGMTIENNKKLLDYAKYLWLKEKKFIPFPYILLNSSILLNKCYDTIFPLLNKESLKINFFLLKKVRCFVKKQYRY